MAHHGDPCDVSFAISFNFHHRAIIRSSHRRCSVKKVVFRNFAKFTGKHLCQSIFFNKVEAWNFIKKETLAQMFSCEFCEISKNTFFHRTPLVAASELYLIPC